MPIRPNMQPLIDYLRQQGQANLSDSFYGVSYWSDQQLQDILDQHKIIDAFPAIPKKHDGTKWGIIVPPYVYIDPDEVYFLDNELDSLTLSYTYDMWTKVFTFDSAPPTLSAIGGDYVHMFNALADLWGQKAAQRFQYVDSRAGQNVLHLQQEYQHCIERQQYYRNKIIKRFKRV